MKFDVSLRKRLRVHVLYHSAEFRLSKIAHIWRQAVNVGSTNCQLTRLLLITGVQLTFFNLQFVDNFLRSFHRKLIGNRPFYMPVTLDGQVDSITFLAHRSLPVWAGSCRSLGHRRARTRDDDGH